MKQECQIVQDLLPIYEEKLASKGSIDYIKEHCRTCEQCNQIMERSIGFENVITQNKNDSPQPEIRDERNLKRAIYKSKLKIGIKLYNVIYLIFLASYIVRNIYLIMNSPFTEVDRTGYKIIYYSPRSAIVGLVFLVFILILSNSILYIVERKIMKRK